MPLHNPWFTCQPLRLQPLSKPLTGVSNTRKLPYMNTYQHCKSILLTLSLNGWHTLLCIAFSLGINLHSHAAEIHIAKFPPFVQAATASYLAPPVLVLGINNAGPDTLRNIPHQYQTYVDGWANSERDFTPVSTYLPPIRVGTTRFPDVPITNAPVDGYAAYYANNLPAGSAPYTLTDYFDGGSFYKNLTTAYKNPLNQIAAGQYIYGSSSTIDHTKPFFWQKYCPPSPPNPFCGNTTNYWPTGLHVIENDTTLSIYKFKNPLPSGCTTNPAPIVINCMQLDDTVSGYTDLHQNFANWYSYYSRNIFGQKISFHSILNNIPEKTTIYCNQFNRSFPEYMVYGYGGVNNPIENPCKKDSFTTAVVYSGSNNTVSYNEFSNPITTAAQKEILLRYLNLSPQGYESGASMNTVSFLTRVKERMHMPATGPAGPLLQDLYYGRKNNNDPTDLEINYCRKIYMYLTDPLQLNTTGNYIYQSAGYSNSSGASNPMNIFLAQAQYYFPPSQSEYTSFALTNGYNQTNYTGEHVDIVSRVFDLYHYDHKTGNGAPNILPRNFPAGSNYWDPLKDPANWQNIRTWSQNNFPYNASYNGQNNNYNFSALYTVMNNAGRVTAYSNMVNTMNAEINAPLSSTAASAAGRSAGLAISGQILQTDGVQYGAFYDGSNWTGRVEARQIGSSGGSGNLIWNTAGTLANPAGTIPSHLNRNIKTIARNGTSSYVVDFKWDNLSSSQKAALLTSSITTLVGASNAGNAGNMLADYLRGDASNEANPTTSTGYFRKRAGNMGDVLSSTPVIIQSKNLGYGTLPAEEGSTYSDFVNAEKNKTKLIAVGANDGMLHFFKASSTDGTGNGDGSETFAFVPSALIGKLGQLAMPTYGHEYYVDGGLLHQHAFVDGSWRSVLVGSAGAGAKSVFAIDVTNRENPQILFELTSDQVADLGFQFGVPRLARLQNGTVGKWVMVHGNGFESTTGTAKLLATTIPSSYVVTPSVQVVSIPGATATENGLAPPAIWSVNHTADVMYAGDKKGKLWRFNINGTTISAANNALFSAVSPSVGGPTQPFTSKPDLALHPQGGLMVYAGTGSIYRSDDLTNKDTQSIYAIWDHPSFTGTTSRGQLLQQKISTDGNYRVTTNNAFNYAAGKRGWFMDLKLDSTNDTGERIVASPNVLFGRVMFNTYLPIVANAASGCTPIDEKSWFMSLDAFDGTAPKKAIFDINGDKKITAADAIGGQNPSGQQIAATSSSVSIGLTYQDQKESTSATPSSNQSYAGAPGSCSASHTSVKQGNKDMCVPKDSCGKGFMWIKAGQNSSDSLSSICVNANQQKPRLSWKQLQ